MVGEPDSGAAPARTLSKGAPWVDGLTSPEPVAVPVTSDGAAAVVRGPVVEDDRVVEVEPGVGLSAPFAGVASPVAVVPRGELDEVDLGCVDEVARGVPGALDLELGLVPGLVLGLVLGFGLEGALGLVLGLGLDEELGLGVLAAAGGAVSGAPPEPKANPMTVPGAGL